MAEKDERRASREKLKKTIDKINQINNFMEHLDDFVGSKAADAAADCNDSYTGMGASDAARKLENSLYELFDIEMEDNG